MNPILKSDIFLFIEQLFFDVIVKLKKVKSFTLPLSKSPYLILNKPRI
ncbi:hypothetical protein SAMN05216269_107198 [Flavobacterium xinjiangense]|uniref:Uncharacterized protein n=1 Tax=Flavobacterium xinjiangense TaxID=178356 RepID=A0A1M7LYF8_9FLAO|nr:hypothetical protein SAMN05216269_107198 [Flavobacterium xinjiangense]